MRFEGQITCDFLWFFYFSMIFFIFSKPAFFPILFYNFIQIILISGKFCGGFCVSPTLCFFSTFLFFDDVIFLFSCWFFFFLTCDFSESIRDLNQWFAPRCVSYEVNCKLVKNGEQETIQQNVLVLLMMPLDDEEHKNVKRKCWTLQWFSLV
jgi:hypothetical protein